MPVAIRAKSVYHKKFKFDVAIGGVRLPFQTFSELAWEAETIEHPEGGSLYPYKSPGMISYPDVTLTKGIAFDPTDFEFLNQWAHQVISPDAISGLNPLARGSGQELLLYRNVIVTQYSRGGLPLKNWTLYNAFPNRFKVGDWDNEADENQILELGLAYEYFEATELDAFDAGALTGFPSG